MPLSSCAPFARVQARAPTTATDQTCSEAEPHAHLKVQWSTVTFNPTTTALALNGGSTVNITHGQSVPVSITVVPNTGTGTPTGDVSLLIGEYEHWALGPWTLSAGSVSTNTSALPGGSSYQVIARYAGDATYAPSTSAVTSITVSPEPSTTTVSVLTRM
jgi:Bacterial Ig-like domain (group 3)